MSEFCPRDCEYLSLTEEQQYNLQKENIFKGHYCTKYNDALYHMLAHPRLYRCEECLKEDKL